MSRRTFLQATLAILATSPYSRSAGAELRPPTEPLTRWKVRASEGFDAIAFLGPLSGRALYTRYYAADAQAFAARLPASVRDGIALLWKAADDEGLGLLGPNLSLMFSTDGNDATLDTLLVALRERERRVLPKYRAGMYWNAEDWAWLDRHAGQLDTVFTALRDTGFAQFRTDRAGPDLRTRLDEIQRALAAVDVIFWQQKLTGRTFDPTIEVVLLQYAKPHGIKVQGQTFLQSLDYDTATTIRVAAHEMLHPPIPMDGSAAQAALAVLAADPLIPTIVRDHDPRWGYTTLKGLLDEDLVEALDQLVSEALGVARNPADRWRQADDGMHVLAGALYGLLRDDRWIDTGGSIEDWLADAVRAGRLAPGSLHASASRVLERDPARLWPLASAVSR